MAKRPPKVSVPYAPTAKGKAAERSAKRKRKVRPKKEAAGPYRSQSSVPSIRSKATKREHRKVPVPATPAPSAATKRGRKAFAVQPLGKTLRQAARREARTNAAEQRALATLKAGMRAVPPSPQTAYQQARYAGIRPPARLREEHPRAYKKAERAFYTNLSKKENLGEPEDLTTLITTVVPGGIGVAQLAKQGFRLGGKQLAREAVSQLAGKGEATVAKSVATAAAPKTAVRASRNVARRALRRETIKRAPKAQRQFTSVLPGTGALKGAAVQSTPVVRGHEQALVEEPGKTLKTTLRIAPGVVTAPVGMVADVGLSVGRLASTGAAAAGVPGARSYSSDDILNPLKGQLDAQVEFAKEVEKVVTSNDADYVKRQVENHLGLLLPAMAAPVAARTFKPVYARALERLRRNKEVRRALTGRQRRPVGEKAQTVLPSTERRKARKGEAKRAATTKAHAEIETQARGAAVLKHARKAKGPKKVIRKLPASRSVRNPKATREVAINPGDAVSFLVRHGVSRKLDDAVAQIKHIHDRLDPDTAAGLPRHKINTLDMTTYLLEHPEVLRDQNLWKAVDAYKGQAPGLQTSETARVQPIMQAHADPGLGQRDPGLRHFDRVPIETRKLTKAKTRKDLRTEISRDRQALKRAAIKGDRAKVRTLARQIADKRAGLYSDLTKAERKEILDELAEAGVTDKAEITSRIREARAEKAARTDKGLEQEYLDQANALIEQFGYEQPAYVTQADVRGRGAPAVSAVGGQLPKIPAAVKQRGGRLQEIGAVEESLPALLRESIRVPVARKHIFANVRDFINELAVKFNGKTEITSREAGKLIDDGVFDPRHNILIPRQLYKRAFDDLARGDESGMAALRQSVNKDAQTAIMDALHTQKGRRYVVVPRERATEFFAQTEALSRPQHVVAKLNRASSRAILGTSPAWAAMQVLAEGTQAMAAVNPYRLYRGMKAFRDMPLDKQIAFQAWAGETPGVAIAPKDVQLGLRNGDMAAASDAFGVANKTAVGRGLKSLGTAELLGMLDKRKGGFYRRAVAAGKIDRELNSRLHKFTGGLQKLWRSEDRIAGHLKDKPLTEQLQWFVDHPQHMRKIQTYLDDVMGNWNALTRHERTAASVVMFYPFLRMSLRWLLWSFPKQHPVKASIFYYLGQQNANELQKMLHGDPSFFNWAQTPLHAGKGGEATALVDLGRMAPGANALFQGTGGAIGGTASGPWGAQALQTIQPWMSAVATAVTGVSPLGGRQSSNSAAQAGAQLLALPLPFRLAGIPDELPGQGSDSPTSQAYKREGGEGSTATLRKAILPVIPKPLDQERRKVRLSELNREKYKNPTPSPLSANPDVAKAVFDHDWALAEKLAKQNRRSRAQGTKATSLTAKMLGEPLGELTKEESEILSYIQGGIFIPQEESELRKSRRRGAGGPIFGGPGGEFGPLIGAPRQRVRRRRRPAAGPLPYGPIIGGG